SLQDEEVVLVVLGAVRARLDQLTRRGGILEGSPGESGDEIEVMSFMHRVAHLDVIPMPHGSREFGPAPCALGASGTSRFLAPPGGSLPPRRWGDPRRRPARVSFGTPQTE